MERLMVNESKMVCCQKKEEILNKISAQETPIIESVSEWIRWTKSKKVCQECKEFRADSLNVMDKETNKVSKDTYLKKYFTVE